MKNGYKTLIRKKDYVDQKYIEDIQHYVYNDLDLKELYPEEEKIDKERLKQILKPGEKWAKLNLGIDGVVLTSFGRAINVDKIRQYSVRITPYYIHLYIDRTRVDFPAEFKKNKWEYDLEELKDNYKKYKWVCRY